MPHPFTTTIAYDRPEDAERQYKADELRKLNPGDKVIFNSVYVEDKFATYDGEVVTVQDNYITLKLTIRPMSTRAGVLGVPIPYNFAVDYYEVGRACYIWKPIGSEELQNGQY